MENLIRYTAGLDQELDRFISVKLTDYSESEWIKDFLKKLQKSTKNGKHLRGNLICMMYSSYTGLGPGKEVFSAAIALEIMHNALLIQDDVIDQDQQRRGLPSMHRLYGQQAEAKNIKNPSHFGESMAVCASDIAFFLAFELLAKATADIESANELNSIFIKSLTDVCEGQMRDIYLESVAKKPDKKTVFEVMRLKTASYSIALPMVMGLILAKSGKDVQRKAQSCGMDIGTIFQIRDDELGAVGQAEKLGKPVGSDIRRAKKTLIYHYLFKNCSETEIIKLDKIFGNEKATDKDISLVQKLISDKNISDLIEEDISKLRISAFEKINDMALSEQIKKDLMELTVYSSERNR